MSSDGIRLNPDKIPTNLGNSFTTLTDMVTETTYLDDGVVEEGNLEDPFLYPIYKADYAGLTISPMDALVYSANYYNSSPSEANKTLVLLPLGYSDVFAMLGSNVDTGGGGGGFDMGSIGFSANFTESNLTDNLLDGPAFGLQLQEVITAISSEVDGTIFVSTLPNPVEIGALWDKNDLLHYFPDDTDAAALLADGDRFTMLTRLINQLFGIPFNETTLTDENVLSTSEQTLLINAVTSYNEQIRSLSQTLGFIVVDVAAGLDLSQATPSISVSGSDITKRWGFGGGFTGDGITYSNTVNATIANYFIEAINQELGMKAPLIDIATVFSTDPYQDSDGDGFAPGRSIGMGEGQVDFISAFIFDSDDSDPEVHPDLSSLTLFGGGGGF